MLPLHEPEINQGGPTLISKPEGIDFCLGLQAPRGVLKHVPISPEDNIPEHMLLEMLRHGSLFVRGSGAFSCFSSTLISSVVLKLPCRAPQRNLHLLAQTLAPIT